MRITRIQSLILLMTFLTGVYCQRSGNCSGGLTLPYSKSRFMKKLLKSDRTICDRADALNCRPGYCLSAKRAIQGIMCRCYRLQYVHSGFLENEGLYRSYCTNYRQNPCDRCNKGRTKFCKVISRTAAQCICSKGYDPHNFCTTLIDACKSQLEHSITGNEACNVENGNQCVSVMGVSYYCLCRSPYKENKDLVYSNCKQKTDACHRKLCAHQNQCNVKTKACDCKLGFSGYFCEKQADEAGQMWSAWSACTPACANFGYKTSVRGCVSNVHSMFCGGTKKRWRRCLPQGCGFILDSEDLTSRLKLNSEELRNIILIVIFGTLMTVSILICFAELMTPKIKRGRVLNVER